MVTEVSKKIRSGFFLDAIGATRIKDALNEQMKKASGGHDAAFAYEVKFANGAISKPTTLDDILKEENDGSRRITRLRMTAAAAPEEPAKFIATIQFSDISDNTNADDVPMSYNVRAEDQDWAFVTASTIDERIDKVKTATILSSFDKQSGGPLSFFFGFPLVVLIGLFVLTFHNPTRESDRAFLDALKAKTSDVLDFMYQLELHRITTSTTYASPFWLLLVPIGAMILIFLGLYIGKFIPLYTFYWNDSTKRYDRRMGILKFATGVVGLTLILGLFVNYVSMHLF